MNKFFVEAGKILKPLFGVLSSQIIVMIINTTDLIYATKFGVPSLAAISVAYGCFVPITLFFAGLMRIAPLLSFELGEKNQEYFGKLAWHNFIFTVIFGILGGILVYFFSYKIALIFGVGEDIWALSREYLQVIGLGMLGFMLYFYFRTIFEAVLKTEHIFYTGVVAYFCDLGLNALNFHYFEFGLVGIAMSHIASYYVWALGLFLMYRFSKIWHIGEGVGRVLELGVVKRIFKFSGFLGFSNLIESVFFTSSSMMVAKFGAILIGSYKLLLNTTTLLLMIPATMGIIIANIISYRLGASKFLKVLGTIFAGFGLFLAFLVVCISALWNFHEPILAFYSDNPEIIHYASGMLSFVIIIFFIQGVNMLLSSIIRAFNRTYYIWLTTFFCYWVIGLPLIYLLSNTDNIVEGMGIEGIFSGMIFAYLLGSIIFTYLVVRCYRDFKRELL